MLEGPCAVPFEIFRIAFHARHVCLIDIALFLSLSLQALCRFLGNVPYPPTKCHTTSSKSSRKASTVYECQKWEKPWDKHVRLSGIESKLNYWSLVQKIIALWSKKKTTFQMWRSFCHAALCIFSDWSLLMLQQSVFCGNCRGWCLQLSERRSVINERFMLEYKELWSFLSFK